MKQTAKFNSNVFLFALLLVGLFSVGAAAQSNPPYTIEQSVIATGGGTSTDATNNVYSVTGTIGQTIAGERSTNAPYAVTGGFWQAAAAPTAAGVTVGGRALTSDGRGIRNVLVTLTEADGTSRTVSTGAFGYYRFADVSVGQTVTISVNAKRFGFDAPVQVINVFEETLNIDFLSGLK